MKINATPDPVLTARFADAVRLAVELHAQQARKGSTVPYLGHLFGVCGLVIDDGGSEDEAIAALLHDAVEDQGGARTLDRIRTQFGNNVATIVEGCTDTDVVPKPPWRERKEAYIEHLNTAPDAVLRVAAADKLNNLRAILRDYRRIGDGLWEIFNPDANEVWYYAAVLAVFEERRPGPLTEELRWTYAVLLELMQAPERLTNSSRAG
jgi:(p)ppGpp synthase/HD superfamily hydrolase